MPIDYKSQYYEVVKPNYKQFDEFLPEYWQMKYLDRFTKLLELLPDSTDIDLLDIGCGRGRAMSYYKSMGIACLGVEPSSYASQEASNKGLEVINGHFMDVSLEKKFDVIHIEQVLSHAPDYPEILNRCATLLNKEGVILVEEPNDYNELQKKLKKRYGEYWVVPDHANYFNFDSLSQALNKAGLEVVYKTATFPMEFFELMGDHYIGDDQKGRAAHAKRFSLLDALGPRLRAHLKESMANLGLGRDVVLYAKGVKNNGINKKELG